MSSTSRRYSSEVGERAVRMVFEHQHEYGSQWAAIVSIAGEGRPYVGDVAELGAAGRGRRGPPGGCDQRMSGRG